MKKQLFLLFIGFTFSLTQAQEITDALRYAQDNLNGTARFRAMSGAFGALGGDLSSLNINPAGSAIFSNNQISLSLTNFNTKNKSNYFGTKTNENNNSFDLNQAGGVFVFKSTSNDWKKISLAINYENSNNFDNSLFSAGTNPTNSVADYFLYYANTGNNGTPIPQEFVNRNTGESISDLYSYLGNNLPSIQYPKLNGFAAQQAMLAFYNQTYIIDAVDINNPNSSYISLVRPGGNYYQENSISSKGYNGKLSFNASTSYKDKLYLGINLNSHFTDYTQSSSFYEENSNTLDINDMVKRLQFDNDLHTSGTGFSFQFGAIAKITNEIRLGFAYESPTWYRLTDELSQRLISVSGNSNGELPQDVADPKYINYYEPYKLQTPSKLTGSFAYIFGKTGLISIDYAIKDYSSTIFKPENDPYFRDVNNNMSSILDKTNELKVGGEYKIEKWSLRAGYRYEQSPYNNKTIMGNLNGYSAGLGYNFGATKVDLSYSTAKRDSQNSFFSQGFTEGADIKTKNNNVSMTLLFEL